MTVGARWRAPKPTVFTVPKVSGQRNEDAFQYSSRGVYALSDGASISFASADWAQILVRHYARRPELTNEWLTDAIGEYSRLFQRDDLPWMQQAAYDRGSFASLLGVRLTESGLVQVLAIGDSIAVLCDGDRVVSCHSYTEASQFAADPQLLSTNGSLNSFLQKVDVSYDLTADWSFAGLSQPALLCMTDALGHWLLSWSDVSVSPISLLRRCETRPQFERLVEEERQAGRMRRDDTTLIALW